MVKVDLHLWLLALAETSLYHMNHQILKLIVQLIDVGLVEAESFIRDRACCCNCSDIDFKFVL